MARHRTIVFENGQRIEGRNYCLFDMMVIDKVLPSIIDGLFELDFMKEYQSDVTEEDKSSYHAAVQALNEGVKLINFKKEFNAILNIVGTVAKDTELMDALIGGKGLESLMTDPNNFFSIDAKHIRAFRDAITKMDDSSLLYSALIPVIRSALGGKELGDTLNDIGLNNKILVEAINQDTRKEHHTFFHDFASLLDNWEGLADIYTLTGSSDSNGLMNKLKENDGALVDTLVSILSVLYKNPIINPTPEPGDWYEKNENLYGLLEYVFSLTSEIGIKVTRDTLRNVESPSHTWDDEFNAIGSIIKYIATHDVLNAADMFSSGLTREHQIA